jgi:hypothetical protein
MAAFGLHKGVALWGADQCKHEFVGTRPASHAQSRPSKDICLQAAQLGPCHLAQSATGRKSTATRSTLLRRLRIQRSTVGRPPATPSLPWNHREPLCEPPFPQVTPDRQGRSYRFSCGKVMCSLQASSWVASSKPPRGSSAGQQLTRVAQWRTACCAGCQQARATTLSRLEPSGLPRMGALGDVEADEGQLHPEQAGVSPDGPDDAK